MLRALQSFISEKLLSPMSVHHRPVEVVGVKVLGQSTSSTFYVKRYPQVLCGFVGVWPEGALSPTASLMRNDLLNTARRAY